MLRNDKLGSSERRTCREIGVARSTQQYKSRAQNDDDLRLALIRLMPKCPNHIWAFDFVHDKLSNGRPYKMLTVLDEYTREALCVAVAAKM